MRSGLLLLLPYLNIVAGWQDLAKPIEWHEPGADTYDIEIDSNPIANLDSFLSRRGIDHTGLNRMHKAMTAVELVHDELWTRGGTCDLSNERWIFVMGVQDSGAKQVRDMLNSIPGVYIAGENAGAMNTMMGLFEKVQKTGFEQHDTGAWMHNEISQQNLLCSIQHVMRLIIGKYDPSKVKLVGFKEIHHKNPQVLDFFSKVFPTAQFIISSKEQHAGSQALEKWAGAARNKRRTFVMRKEELDVRKFNRMLLFLGVKKCHYISVADASNSKAMMDGQCFLGTQSLPALLP